MTENNSVLKLHIGCGQVYKEGWVNIDNNSDNNIQKLDLNFDLRNPLPYEDNSVDFIFNEHFLEHLTIEEGLRALKDFRRVLKPGGILRVAMPDLQFVIDLYLDPNWKEHESLRDPNLKFIKTRAELINICFRWWGHKHLYDSEELERRLKEAGFENITQFSLRESANAELRNLETRNESTLIMEGKK